jgi:hypothetical protein
MVGVVVFVHCRVQAYWQGPLRMPGAVRGVGSGCLVLRLLLLTAPTDIDWTSSCK